MSSTHTPKLHLNENISPRLAIELREYGIDVTSSHEEELLAEPDDVQFAFAAAQQRAIVTFNFADFARLHKTYEREGKEHWGVILSTEEPIGVLFHRLIRLTSAVTADKLKNQVRWLNEFK